MFDSGVSVKDLVAELNTEVDIALDIPNATYVQWINSLQQMLYTEVIKEQYSNIFNGFVVDLSSPYIEIPMSSFVVPLNEEPPRFEDIYAVYVKYTDNTEVQLIKSTVASGVIFPNTFYKSNNNLAVNIDTVKTPEEIKVIYIAKPALVTLNTHKNINDANVMVPVEFIDLVKAKLRGEAYKLANEADLAAMWLNDYNILLETFKAWVAEKSPSFGI